MQLGNLLVVLFEQRKFREAIELLTQELQNQPGDPDLLTQRSSAYMRAGMPREALADLRAAAQSGYSNAQNNLGVYYMQGVPGVLQADANVGEQWFLQSAAQGNIEGKKNLEVVRQPVGYTCGEGKICLYSQSRELFLSE
jgi:TPR repeat protein